MLVHLSKVFPSFPFGISDHFQKSPNIKTYWKYMFVTGVPLSTASHNLICYRVRQYDSNTFSYQNNFHRNWYQCQWTLFDTTLSCVYCITLNITSRLSCINCSTQPRFNAKFAAELLKRFRVLFLDLASACSFGDFSRNWYLRSI